MTAISQCPFAGRSAGPPWRETRPSATGGPASSIWPSLPQHVAASNPLGAHFDYARAFSELDPAATISRSLPPTRCS